MKNPAESAEIPVDKPSINRWAIAAFFLILAFHSVLAVRMFPTPGSIVERDSPVLVVDHAIHEDHGTLGARFLRESVRTWGYDPFFMAGYPESPIWDSSSNPSILFCLLDGGVGYRGYKVGLLALSILVLFAVAGGAWAAGLRSSEVVLASGLFCFVFWTGFSNGLWRSGLFAFVSASAGVGLLLGLCVRFGRAPSWWGWLLLTGVGTGLFFLHVTAPILAIGGLLAFLLANARKHGGWWFLTITGAGLIAVLLNLFWLIPLWRFRSIRTGSSLFMTTNSAWFLLDHFLYPSVEGRAALILLVLGGRPA